MKQRYNVLVRIGEQIIHNKNYRCLKEIGEDLNLTYQQTADISTNRANKFLNNKFKYAPQISIKKISYNINNAEESKGEEKEEG
tara:strand:- start:10943 stop:11194 length:252 start_codon:yes stop_codon:yes gene_type:complete